MVLNQNSSADRLGLNPAGLTKWEKHYKNVKKPYLKADFLFKGNALFGRSSQGLSCPTGEGDSYRVLSNVP